MQSIWESLVSTYTFGLMLDFVASGLSCFIYGTIRDAVIHVSPGVCPRLEGAITEVQSENRFSVAGLQYLEARKIPFSRDIFDHIADIPCMPC